MHAKNNRQNTDFQIVHFLVGACHTADGAYALLCDLHEDREAAVRTIEATRLRDKAKRERAASVVNNPDAKPWEQDEARADVVELDALAGMMARNIAAAQAELTTLERCMAALQPLRRFAHLPDPQAHQAAQAEEWRLELMHRAENHLLTTGTVAPELLATMRMHPAFADGMLPQLMEMGHLLETPNGRDQLMNRLAGKRPEFMALPAFATLALEHNPGA